MTAVRRRLDNEIVRRALAPTRSAAQELIAGGRVLVSGAIAHKASRRVAASEPVHISGEGARFVSRGGEKLDAALDTFGVGVRGCRALDAGASTGGFTDCLLQRGAAQVVAVDVGWGQLDARLRSDQRVIVRERCNVRHLSADSVGEPVDFVAADLSFISLRTVMANLACCAAPGADIVLLVKPQFEAGRREASRGKGVVRDRAVWLRVLIEVVTSAVSAGLAPQGITPSPIRGAAGNVEFFLHCRRLESADDAHGAADRLADAGFDVTAAAEEAVCHAEALHEASHEASCNAAAGTLGHTTRCTK